MNNRLKYFLIILSFLFLFAMLSSCRAKNSVQNAPAPFPPADILAQIEPPGRSKEGDIIHVQWIYEELEGLPPNARESQFIRTINEVWVESESPWRFHLSTKIEPGGLILYDRGWDGMQIWNYSYDDDPLHAVLRLPEINEIPSTALDVTSFIDMTTDLLARAKETPDRLREIGVEEIEPWGKVRSIAYDWDGATAATRLYPGYPHTIIFKVADENHWLIEWMDIIHTDRGDVRHRRQQLTAWEELDSSKVSSETWTFIFPEWVSIVEELPETAHIVAEVEEPVRTIMGWKVKDFGWIPWLPTYLPEGAMLSRVSVLPQWEGGYYHVTYEIGGNPSIVIDQALDLTYGWGNTPEIIELSWATVELGSIDPLGPPGWVALIRLHQQGDEQLPNINLLVEIPDRELMLEIIESLQPATE